MISHSKKYLILAILCLPIWTTQAVKISDFVDVSTEDKVWEPFVDYTERGLFSGIPKPGTTKRLVAADDVILKSHAALFLAKVLGNPNPTIEALVEQGVLKAAPGEKELLTHAAWIKMLTNAFEVPITSLSDTQSWFVAPYALAKTIRAVEEELPFNYASRRFVLTTTHKYESFFAVDSLNGLLSERERVLMEVRDLLVDPQAQLQGVENKLWHNIITGQDLQLDARAQAIQNFNFAALLLLDMRQNPSQEHQSRRKDQVFYFLDRAVKGLPDTGSFANDLRAIADEF